MDISNPLFRESIIAMDGQIVRPRVRTLAQAAALTPRANVLAFKDDSIDEYYMPRALVEANGEMLLPKIVPIGIWNMDATQQINVEHGLTGANIREVRVMIIADDGTTFTPLDLPQPIFGATVEGWVDGWGAVNVMLSRRGGGAFDVIQYDDGAMNRGHILIWYVP